MKIQILGAGCPKCKKLAETLEFGKGRSRIGDELDGGHGPDPVEAGVREGQGREVGAQAEERGVRMAAEGALQHVQGEVDTGHRGPAGEYLAGEDAGAAARIEDTLARLRVEQFEQQFRLTGVHQPADGGGEPAVVGFGPGVEGGGGHRQSHGDRVFPGHARSRTP